MSDIVIRRRHRLDHGQAREAAEKIAAHLNEKFDLRYGWDGERLLFRRSGVSGELQVQDMDVEIRIRLGLLLIALKPTIEREIHRYFDESFGGGDSSTA